MSGTPQQSNQYDPRADANDRWPGWLIMPSADLEFDRIIWPDRKLILFDTGGDPVFEIALAVALLDLGVTEAKNGELEEIRQDDAVSLAALRLGRATWESFNPAGRVSS